MNTSTSSIAERIDETCHSNKCESGKCLIDLTDLPSPPNRLIVDMDCNELDIPPDNKRCDYIIFLDSLFDEDNHSMIILPVEMKSGSIHGVTSIIEQIESGIEYAKK